MGKQYRCELIGGYLEGVQTQSKIVAVGEYYGGCWKNEMKIEGVLKNEMKNLGEIFVKIGEEYLVRLMDIRDVVMNVKEQIDGHVIEEHGYVVSKDGKQVWNLKRRYKND